MYICCILSVLAVYHCSAYLHVSTDSSDNYIQYFLVVCCPRSAVYIAVSQQVVLGIVLLLLIAQHGLRFNFELLYWHCRCPRGIVLHCLQNLFIYFVL